MTTAPPPSDADITDIRDWALALILALPLLLAAAAHLFAFDYASLFPAYHLAVHYTLYVVGLALVVGQFAQEALRLRLPGWAGWAGRLLALIVIADVAAPFRLVPAFSMLKALFYLLVLVQLSAFVLVERRVLRWSRDPAPFTLLLALTTLLFYQANAAAPSVAVWVVVAAMLALTVLQFLSLPWLNRRRGLLMLAAGLGAAPLAGYALFQSGFALTLSPSLPALIVPPMPGAALPFAPAYFCLFLYLLALAHHEGAVKLPGRLGSLDLTRIAALLFAVAFFFLYVLMNLA